MLKTLKWLALIALGFSLGWAGSREWSGQRQIRAGLRLVANTLTGTPRSTNGLATATSVALPGMTFDLASILDSPDLGAEIDRLAAVIETLTRDQAADAAARMMEAVLNLGPNQLRKVFAQFKSGRGLNDKMERLGRAFESKLSGPDAERHMQRLMRQLIVVDPERALLFADAMPQEARGGFSSQMYGALALQQPERVVEMMLDPDASRAAGLTDWQRADALTSAFKTLAARSLSDAAERWRSMPEGPLKNAALKGLIEVSVDQNPRDAWVWSDRLSGESRIDALRAVLPHLEAGNLHAWIEQNAASAGKAGSESELAYLAVNTLAARNPSAAIAWFGTMEWAEQTLQQDGFFRDFARSAASDRTQCAQAAADVLALPPGERRDKLLGYMARSWAEGDASAARAWIATLTPEDRSLLQPRFSNDRYSDLAREVGLDEFVVAPRPNAPQAPQDRINQIFSERDGDRAIALIEEDLSAGVPLDAYRGVIPSMAARLATTDRERAVTWAEGQPEPMLRDTSLASIATQAGLAPEAAAGVVARIADPVIRQQTERLLAARRLGLTISE